MKAKITLLIGAVALVTLSFTFSTAEKTTSNVADLEPNVSAPIGGLIADEVVK